MMMEQTRRELSDLGLLDRATYHDYESRPAWIQGRRLGIGASESAALFGAAPERWCSPVSIYESIVHDVRTERDAEVLRWGLRLERSIAQGYADDHGVRLLDIGAFTIVRPKDKYPIQCTPDFLIPEMQGKDGPGICQVKNSDAHMIREFDSGLPRHYQIQGQHEMLATGCRWGIFPILFGGNQLKVFELEAIPEFHSKLLSAASGFWNQHIETFERPTIDGSKATLDALKTHFSRVDPETTIELPSEFTALFAERSMHAAENKLLKALIQQIDARLLEALGHNEAGIIPDVGRVSYKSVTMPERITKGSTFRRASWPRAANAAKAEMLLEKLQEEVARASAE